MKDLKDITQEDFIGLCMIIGLHFKSERSEFVEIDMWETDPDFARIDYTIYHKEDKSKKVRFEVSLSFSKESIYYYCHWIRHGYSDGTTEREHRATNLSIGQLRYLKEKGYNIGL